MFTIKIVKRLKLSIRNSDLEARKGSCYLYIHVHAFSKYNCAFVPIMYWRNLFIKLHTQTRIDCTYRWSNKLLKFKLLTNLLNWNLYENEFNFSIKIVVCHRQLRGRLADRDLMEEKFPTWPWNSHLCSPSNSRGFFLLHMEDGTLPWGNCEWRTCPRGYTTIYSNVHEAVPHRQGYVAPQ